MITGGGHISEYKKYIHSYCLLTVLIILCSCYQTKIPSAFASNTPSVITKTDLKTVTQITPGQKPVIAALRYLEREMDIFHIRTVVFDDLESGGERFIPSGWMKGPNQEWPKNDGRLEFTYPTQGAREGATCLRVQWAPPLEDKWVGVAWQYPENNWGTLPGQNLQGATRLRFWAKGETGTEMITFKFGIIHDFGKKYNDSCPELSTGLVTLSREWQKYEIDLSGRNLSNIVSGFCFVIRKDRNPTGCAFYLDDISINHSRLDAPRLLRSYNIGQRAILREKQEHLRNTCFIYDNALAICAFLSSTSPDYHRRARLIADALVQLSTSEPDGSLYLNNAYACGDLFTISKKNQQKSIPRMPGRMNRGEKGGPSPSDIFWLEDTYAKGVDCGNMAWAMLALLNVWEDNGRRPDSPYLRTAQGLGKWILAYANDNSPDSLGFFGGMEWNWNKGENGAHQPITWKSTEHNIDLAVAFARLASVASELSKRTEWERASERAKGFVRWAQEQGRDDGGRLVTGTDGGTTSPAKTPKPLDPQTWSILAFPVERRQFESALNWAISHCKVKQEDLWGYQFSAAQGTDIWPEGTGQVALALRALGRNSEADEVLRQLDLIMTTAESVKMTPGAMPAAYPKFVKTGFKWDYLDIPHIGATAWFVLAHNAWNPFLGHQEP